MPSCDRWQVRVDRLGCDDRFQHMPCDILRDASDSMRERARQQGEEQLVSDRAVPVGPYNVVTCAHIIIRNARDGPPVVGRPEVAVQHNIPYRRTGSTAHDLYDCAGPWSGVVIERQEDGPADASSAAFRETVLGAQNSNGCVSKGLAWNPDRASILPVRITRPVICGPASSQAVKAESLNAQNRPRAFSALNLPAKRAIRCGHVVVMTADPSAATEIRTGDARQSGARACFLQIDNAVRLDRTEMTTLRQQQGQGSGTVEPRSHLSRRRADLA
jgi:hypothetical protein